MGEQRRNVGRFERRTDAVEIVQGLAALIGYGLGATILLAVTFLIGGFIFEKDRPGIARQLEKESTPKYVAACIAVGVVAALIFSLVLPR